MRIRCFLAGLALVCAEPASAANSVDWIDSHSKIAGVLQAGGCASVRFTSANEKSESKLLDVRGLQITIQSEGDAAGSGMSAGALFACTNTDGDQDGTQDTTACAPLDLVPGGTNRLDGANARGTLTPMAIAGWIYVTPDAATIDAGEVFEAIVCAVR